MPEHVAANHHLRRSCCDLSRRKNTAALTGHGRQGSAAFVIRLAPAETENGPRSRTWGAAGSVDEQESRAERLIASPTLSRIRVHEQGWRHALKGSSKGAGLTQAQIEPLGFAGGSTSQEGEVMMRKTDGSEQPRSLPVAHDRQHQRRHNIMKGAPSLSGSAEPPKNHKSGHCDDREMAEGETPSQHAIAAS
jgi:hypothetical protein